MPDLLTHVVVAWTLCTLLSFKWKQFNLQNTAIVMVGALIPDLYKVQLPLSYLNLNESIFIMPFHLPVGSLLLAGMVSLFFRDRKMIFFFLTLGVATHYLLDLLLVNLGGGMELLYPLSWERFSFNVISPTDYHIPAVALFIAFMVYMFRYQIFRPDNK